jgi:glycosyltransferase involved in cell wall biosynthesis
MRILIVLTYYRPHYSGLTIYAERLARTLVKRGHHVTVLTSRYDKNLPSREIQNGVEVIRPSVLFRLSKGVIMPTMPYWAWSEIRKADIVHLHAPQLDAAPISLLSHSLGKPVVLTYHCDLQLPKGFVHSIANWASNYANHITAKIADVIVTNTIDYAQNSEFLRQFIEKIHPILPPIITNSVSDTERDAFRSKFHIQPNQRIIGMAARLASEKGVEYLAKALPKVLQVHPNARVLFVGPYKNIVGEEAYTQHLAPIIQQLGEHWSFLGILSPVEMSAFFHECEVTVLPSINSTESYGMVQVESMSCGTPVVASDIPGVRVPIRLTSMGRIVPPANPGALAQALVDILDSPKEYIHQTDSLLEQSTPDYVAREYERIFQDLIRSSQ